MPKLTPKRRVLYVRRSIPVFLAVFGVFSLLALNLRAPKTAYATAASTVNFQARLQTASGAIVPDGNYNVEFKLYNVASAGTALWTEDYTSTSGPGSTDVRLQVKDGYLSTPLGSITSFPGTIDWSQQLYLTMNIGGVGTSPSWDGEMNPRLALTASTYAFMAGSAAQAGELSNVTGSNTSTLTFQGSGSGHGNQNFIIQDQGAAGTYDLLTTQAANNSFVQLQSGTPSQQTGQLDISGAATVGSIVTGSLDTASSGSITIGGTYATSVAIGNSSSNTVLLQGNNISQTVTGDAFNPSDIIKTSINSTVAFQVQNADGYADLSVDTQNATVGVNTSTGTAALNVQGVTSDNTKDALSITNDTGAKLAQLTNDGSVKLGGTGQATQLGTNTMFGTQGSQVGMLSAQRVLTGGGGAVTSMSAYIGSVGATNKSYQFGIYTDSGGGTPTPSAYVASSAIGTLTANSLNTLSISATLSPNTHYWLVYWTNDTSGSNNSQYYNAGSGEWNYMSQTWQCSTSCTNGMPNTWTSAGGGAYTFGIYATIRSNTALSISNAGAATFEDTTDSATAFQIQNASGSSLFTADTTNNQIQLGTNTDLIMSGATAYISNPQAQTGSEAFGASAAVGDQYATAVGNGADAAAYKSISIGQGSIASGSYSVAIGNSSHVDTGNDDSIALGASAYAGGAGSIAIGFEAATTAANQVVIGGNSAGGGYISNVYIGSGVTDSTPQNVTIHATGSNTTGVAGADLSLTAGNATTGNANGGNLILQGGGAIGSGVSGAVSISTQDDTGTGDSGSIVIKTGDSSSGTSGNISIDSGVSAYSSGSSVVNDTFESGSCASTTTDFTSWFGLNISNGAPLNESSAQAHGGSCSAIATESATSGGFWGITDAGHAFTTVAGRQYTVSAWVRSTLAQTIDSSIHFGGGGPGAVYNLSTVTATTTGWTQITGTAVAPTGSTYAFIELGSGGGNQSSSTYFDDITVSANVGGPTVDVGTANAQTVSIGNANQQGVTKLQGGSGGVSVAANNGGTVTIQAAGGISLSSATTASSTLTVGSSAGTGGVINNGTTQFATDSSQSFSANGSITNINTYSSIVITATNPSLTLTLPDPSPTTAGKLLYINNKNTGSNDFTLAPTHGSSIVLHTSDTITLLWNGAAWTYSGQASSGINSQTSTQSANFNVQAATSGSVAGTLQANASGTGDILDLKDGSNNLVGSIGSTGNALFKASSNSASAFQIQNSIGSNVLVADTTGITNVVTNPGFEGSSNTGWALKGSATGTTAISSSQAYSGKQSEQVALTSTNIGDGVKFTPTSLSATTYVLSFYMKQTAGTAFGTSLGVGYSNGSDQSCTLVPTLTAQPVPTTGWARYYCTMTMTGTPTYIYWKETDAPASARTFYLDDVQLEQTSNTAPSEFTENKLQLNGTVSSSLILQNASDSTTAFQIQNAATDSTQTNIFTADTLNGKAVFGNIVTNTASVATQVLIQANANNRGIAIESNGTQDALDIYNSSGTNVLGINANGTILPGTNNSVSLGSTSLNFATTNSRTYNFDSTATGTIQFGAAATATGNALNITGETAGGSANNGGAVTVQGGTATTTGTGGLLTLQGGNTTTTGTNGGVTIDAGSGATTANGTVSIGTANASTITVGSTSTNSAITLGQYNGSSTNTINIGNNAGSSTTQAVNIASSASGINNVTIGSTNSTSTTTIQGGTSASSILIKGGAASTATVKIVTSGITSGSTTGTGSITIQSGSGTQVGGVGNISAGTVTVDTGANTGTGTSTLNLGNTNATTVNLGNTTAATQTAIQGGTGSSAIGIQAGTGGTISVGTSNANVITLGNTSSNNALTLQGNGISNVITGSATAPTDVIKTTTNSTGAFQVQTSGGAAVLNVDTTNQIVTTKDHNIGSASNAGGAGRIFSDGFESGAFNQYSTNSGATSIDTTTVRNGKYSAKFAPSGSAAYVETPITVGSTMVLRGYVYVTSQTTGLERLMELCDTSSCSTAQEFGLVRDTNGQIASLTNNGASASVVDSGVTLTTGAWHEIEFDLTIGSGTSGAVNAYLDGTNLASLNSPAANTGTTIPTYLTLGEPASGRTSVANIDDVTLSNGATRPGDSSSLNVNDSLHVGGSSSFGSNVLVQTASNSAYALQIQNAAGSTLLGVDTSGSTVNVGSTGTTAQTSTVNIATSTGAAQTIHIGDGSTETANVTIGSASGASATSIQGGTGNLALSTGANGSGTAGNIVLTTGTSSSGNASIIAKSGTNSTSAFQIQNASGTSFFTADSTAQILNTKDIHVGAASNISGIGRQFSDGFETGQFNQYTLSAGSPAIDTTTVRDGKYSAKFTASSANSYVRTPVTVGSTIMMRAYVYISAQTSGNEHLMSLCTDNTCSTSFLLYRDVSTGDLQFWDGATSSTIGPASTVISLNAWHEIEADFTISNGSATINMYLDGTSVLTAASQNTGTTVPTYLNLGEDVASGRSSVMNMDDVVIDSVRPGDSSSLDVNDTLHVGGTSSFGSGVLVQTANNTTAAFQVQNAGGTSILGVDTTNGKVTVSGGGTPLTVNTTSSSYEDGVLFQLAGTSKGEIGVAGTSSQIANQAAVGDMVIKSISGNILLAAGSSSNAEVTIDTNGNTTFKNVADSTTNSFQIQNSGGVNLFSTNTTNKLVNVGATGADNLATTVNIATTTAIGQTVNIGTGAITSGTDTINIGTGATSSGVDAVAIGSNNSTSSTTINGGTGTSAIGIQAGSAGTIKIGTTNANVITVGNTGSNNAITLQANGISEVMTGSATAPSDTIKTTTNSSSAFQIQNSSGTNLLNVDTSNTAVNLGAGGSLNPFGYTTVGGTGGSGYTPTIWNAAKYVATYSGTISSITVWVDSPDSIASGHNHYEVAIYSDSGGGTTPSASLGTSVSTTYATASGWNTASLTSPVSVTAGTTYWLVYTDDSTTGTNADMVGDTVTGGRLDFSTTVSWSASGMTASWPGNSGNLTDIDKSIYANYSSTGYGLSLGTNGALTASGPATFESLTNSTTAFQIQNNAAASVFTVDTTNNRVIIGTGSTGESTAKILVLDNGNTGSDPTGVPGAMYYNSSLNEFRCYTTLWEACAATQPIDQSYEVDEEFLTGQLTIAATMAIGNNSWDYSTMGGTACGNMSYAGGTGGVAVSASRPGILVMTTGAAASTGCRIRLAGNASSLTAANGMLIGAGQDIKAAVAVDSASSNTVATRVGLEVNTGTATRSTTGGVWWEADRTNNANWEYCYDNSSNTAVCAASGTAIAANTFVRVEIQVVSSTAVNFTINGTTTSLTGITLATGTAVAPNIMCENSGTGAVAHSCYADYFQLRGDESSLR